MLSLNLVLDVEERGFTAMRGLEQDDPRLIHMGHDAVIEVGALEAGMASGKPSAAFCFTLPDGKVALIETSLALFLTAADGLKAKFGDPRV